MARALPRAEPDRESPRLRHKLLGADEGEAHSVSQRGQRMGDQVLLPVLLRELQETALRGHRGADARAVVRQRKGAPGRDLTKGGRGAAASASGQDRSEQDNRN